MALLAGDASREPEQHYMAARIAASRKSAAFRPRIAPPETRIKRVYFSGAEMAIRKNPRNMVPATGLEPVTNKVLNWALRSLLIQKQIKRLVRHYGLRQL